MNRISRFFLSFFLVVGFVHAGPMRPKSVSRIKVMTYNVENLFDAEDSPDTNDIEFTPLGSEFWTDIIIADKIRNLAKIIKDQNADVVALVELENQEMLDRLVNLGGLKAAGYMYHYAGPSKDARGIRGAILSKLPIVDKKSHNVTPDTWKNPQGQIRYTRDVLEVTVDALNNSSGRFITFLVNHWPSRLGGPAGDVKRLEIALATSKIIQNIARSSSGRRVVILGDFNDEVKDASFQRSMRIVQKQEDMSKVGDAVYPLNFDIPEGQRGTYFYARENRWNELDNILIAGSPDLNAKRVPGFHYVEGTAEVVKHEFVFGGKFPWGCQLTSRKKMSSVATRCPLGASDHFPLAASFEYY